MYIKEVKQGDMYLKFDRPLKIVGGDEYYVFLADMACTIGKLTYIRTFSRDWHFIEDITGRDIMFK